jgi:hypothetical protein
MTNTIVQGASEWEVYTGSGGSVSVKVHQPAVFVPVNPATPFT